MASRGSEFALSEALLTLHQGATAASFPGVVMQAVAQLVPADACSYNELAPANHACASLMDRDDTEREIMLPVLAELSHLHPCIRGDGGGTQGTVQAISDRTTRGEWHRNQLYGEFYRQFDVEDQLCFLVPVDRDVLLVVAWSRRRRGFSQDERRMVELLAPHLRLAHANAQHVSRLLDGERLLASPDHGTLRLNGRGAVVFKTSRADHLLDAHYSAREPRTGGLPKSLRSEIQAAFGRATAAQHGLGGLDVRTRSGRLRVSILPSIDSVGAIMAIEEVERQGADLSAGAEELPPRLQRVLEYLLTGLSEKQIAAATDLSRHTVHEYAKRIYRHFGVAGRIELMARRIAEQ